MFIPAAKIISYEYASIHLILPVRTYSYSGILILSALDEPRPTMDLQRHYLPTPRSSIHKRLPEVAYMQPFHLWSGQRFFCLEKG